MKQAKATILSNNEIAEGRFRMRLEAPSVAGSAKAGQFVMVRCADALEPLLRRPLSFHRIEKRAFELLYQVVGAGTEALSRLKRGERLDVIGPLGSGFEILNAKRYPPNAILIAGGIGVAPLLALAERLAFSVERRAYSVILGARTKKHILCEKEFKKMGAKVYIATEDGSRGHEGMATDLLEKILNAKRYPLNAVYACGPRAMLREAARIARAKKVGCQVSFEERMACGTGACLGCAVKTATGYKLACKDGPVFNAGDIIW